MSKVVKRIVHYAKLHYELKAQNLFKFVIPPPSPESLTTNPIYFPSRENLLWKCDAASASSGMHRPQSNSKVVSEKNQFNCHRPIRSDWKRRAM